MNATRLECTTGGHNKFYEFLGIESKGRFTVKALFGRIGQAGQETIIYDGDDKLEANKEYQKKLTEKQKKGYVIVTNGKAATQPAHAEKKTVMFP